jgi:hypothetical protein
VSNERLGDKNHSLNSAAYNLHHQQMNRPFAYYTLNFPPFSASAPTAFSLYDNCVNLIVRRCYIGQSFAAVEEITYFVELTIRCVYGKSWVGRSLLVPLQLVKKYSPVFCEVRVKWTFIDDLQVLSFEDGRDPATCWFQAAWNGIHRVTTHLSCLGCS